MAQVVALYRFPVKGFTQESVSELRVQPDGRIEGDRAFSFRYASGLAPRERAGMQLWSKSKGLTRMEFPSLAALRLTLLPDGGGIRILRGDGGPELVSGPLDEAGRRAIADAVTEYLLAGPEAAHLSAPGRLPLTLMGTPGESRFQDNPEGFISMHSRESLAALGDALGQEISDDRFRSNIAISGVSAWDEISELSAVRIGGVRFAPQEPIGRCLNTHANPETGVRDAEVLTTLTRVIGQSQPTFGRFLLPLDLGSPDAGGVIRVGDEVELVS